MSISALLLVLIATLPIFLGLGTFRIIRGLAFSLKLSLKSLTLGVFISVASLMINSAIKSALDLSPLLAAVLFFAGFAVALIILAFSSELTKGMVEPMIPSHPNKLSTKFIVRLPELRQVAYALAIGLGVHNIGMGLGSGRDIIEATGLGFGLALAFAIHNGVLCLVIAEIFGDLELIDYLRLAFIIAIPMLTGIFAGALFLEGLEVFSYTLGAGGAIFVILHLASVLNWEKRSTIFFWTILGVMLMLYPSLMGGHM